MGRTWPFSLTATAPLPRTIGSCCIPASGICVSYHFILRNREGGGERERERGERHYCEKARLGVVHFGRSTCHAIRGRGDYSGYGGLESSLKVKLLSEARLYFERETRLDLRKRNEVIRPRLHA